MTRINERFSIRVIRVIRGGYNCQRAIAIRTCTVFLPLSWNIVTARLTASTWSSKWPPGNAADLVEKGLVPWAADEDDLSFFGERCPFQSPGQFVGRNCDAAKVRSANSRVLAEFLDDRLAVECLFDPVFGVFFLKKAGEDVSTLFGELDAFAKTVGDVEISVAVISDAEARCITGRGFGRNGKIVAAFPFQAFGRTGNKPLEPRHA